jgi:hypothetical protein
MKQAFLTTILLVAAWSVHAQYNGPAVETCRAYALKEARRDGGQARTVVIERDASLTIERYTRRVGSQMVSSILLGNGAVVYEGAPSAELSFLCMLADEKRAVFFAWQARPNAPALSQCVRSEDLRGKAHDCLELLLRVAEQDLALVYAFRFQEANERGERSLVAYRKSNDEWREYRDAECTRRRDLAHAGVTPEDFELGCRIDLTRRRALDMR